MSTTNSSTYRAAEKRWWDECGIQPKEHFIAVPQYGIKVRILEVGEGAPALFVHGSPSGASIWSSLAGRLPQVRCLLLDRPGCGLSETIDYTHMSPVDLKTMAIATQQAVLDTLNIDRTILVGNSHGGAWTLWFAAAQAQRVERIIWDGAPGYVDGLKMGFMGWLRFPLMGAMMSNMKTSPKSLRNSFKQMGHQASLSAGRFSDAWFDWCVSLFNDTATWRNEIGGQGRALLRGRGLADLTYTPELLRRIVHPTLVLWGEQDNFVSVANGQRFVTALPNAVLKVFPDSGHLPWLDDPAAHASLISAFLAENRLMSAANHSRGSRVSEPLPAQTL